MCCVTSPILTQAQYRSLTVQMVIEQRLKFRLTHIKVKVKVGFLYSATYMVDQEQRALAISEVAVDWQLPMVLQRKWGHPLPVLMDIGPTVAASKHTTAPIKHTRPTPVSIRQVAPIQPKQRTPDYCLLLIYRPRKDERLSWPSWLACSGWFTHISGHPSAAGRATGQRKHAGQGPTLYHSTTQPTLTYDTSITCNTLSPVTHVTTLSHNWRNCHISDTTVTCNTPVSCHTCNNPVTQVTQLSHKSHMFYLSYWNTSSVGAKEPFLTVIWLRCHCALEDFSTTSFCTSPRSTASMKNVLTWKQRSKSTY